MDSICGYVFLDLYLWLCIYGYVYGRVWVCVSGYVFGYVFLAMCMAIGSRSSARPGLTNIRACLSLGPVSTITGTYSSTRPISTNFGSYSFTRPIWMTLRIFPIFPEKNGKICPSM